MNLYLRLAWRNLWRQPKRTWLTTGAMIFLNALLIFALSFQFGMYQMMIDNSLQLLTGHMQVQAEGFKDDQKMRQVVPNVVELADEVREELQSDSVAARGWTFALASSEERSYGIAIYGVEAEYEANVSTLPGLVRQGRYLADNDSAEIVVGDALARNLKVGLGDELTIIGSGLDGSFAAAVLNVVGIIESGVPDLNRAIAEMPIGTFQDVFYMEGAGHQIVIVGDSSDDVEILQPTVESLLPTDGNLVVHDWDTLQPGVMQAIEADIGGAIFIYFILVVLVAFSVLNTQLMSVLERTREFGITMALGLKASRLGRLVMLETALMGVIGFVLGIAIGAAVTSLVAINGISVAGLEDMAAKFNLPDRWAPTLTPLSLLGGPVVVFIFSMIASLYPALRLRWLHPVEAMRSA